MLTQMRCTEIYVPTKVSLPSLESSAHTVRKYVHLFCPVFQWPAAPCSDLLAHLRSLLSCVCFLQICLGLFHCHCQRKPELGSTIDGRTNLSIVEHVYLTIARKSTSRIAQIVGDWAIVTPATCIGSLLSRRLTITYVSMLQFHFYTFLLLSCSFWVDFSPLKIDL